GYTDNTGDPAANVQLSQQRADAVRAALVSAGVDPSMLVAKGYGSANPAASNDTAEGKFRNRRLADRVVKPAGGSRAGLGVTPARPERSAQPSPGRTTVPRDRTNIDRSRTCHTPLTTKPIFLRRRGWDRDVLTAACPGAPYWPGL